MTALTLLLFQPILTRETTKKINKALTLVLLVMLIIYSLVSPVMISAYAGLGGYLSEQLLGTGVSSSLYLGDTADGPIVLGTAPTVITGNATNIAYTEAGTSVTLHGNLTSLNSMERAEVWFIWGYDPTTLVNTTPAVEVTTTGEKTAVLTGYSNVSRVYYQFVAGTDAQATGATQSFTIGEGGMGSWLLDNILTLIIAAGLFIILLSFSKNPVVALILTVIALLAIAIVKATLDVIP